MFARLAPLGTDISFAVEQRRAEGVWQRVEEFADVGTEAAGQTRASWYDTRNYELFELLGGPPSPRPLIPRTVVAEARGLPADSSDETVAEFDRWGDDAFCPSWLGLTELLTFDWHRRLDHSFHLTPNRSEPEPTSEEWEMAKAHVAEWGVPPQGWSCAGDSKWRVKVTGFRDCWEFAGGEFLAVVLRMAACSRSDAEAVRCVFWFDR